MISDRSEPTLDRSGDTSPYPFFAHRRSIAPLWHGTALDFSAQPESMRPHDVWTAMDYASVFEVLRNNTTFSSEVYDWTIGMVTGKNILGMTGKRHHSHRNLVARAFRAKSLARWEAAVMLPICHKLVDDLVTKDDPDLVRDLTLEFPTQIIATILGLPPEDLAEFRRLSFDLISIEHNIGGALEAAAQLRVYFGEQIEQRRSKPTEDVIGDLVTAEVDGEKLTDEAIIGFLGVLLPAGLETTYRSSGNLLQLLLTHRDQLAAVQADRALIAPAIEEALRFETPLTTVVRVCTEDTELGGESLPKDAQVLVCMGSANRDETRWDRADEFDIHREPIPHISFGNGEHSCLGMHLARLETRIAINCLLDRALDFELVPGSDSEIKGVVFRSPERLPVNVNAVAP